MKDRTSDKERTQYTLEQTLDIINDGVWDWNANTGYVYRSPGWYRMLGYEVDSLDANVFTWENIIHPDDYERVMARFQAYITRQCDSYQLEYRCRTASGDYLWVEDRGRVVEWNEDGSVGRMIGAHRDIDQQKRAQLALEAQNRRLSELVDERTGELVDANRELQGKMAEIKALVERDALTGAYNRHRFDDALQLERERASRHGSPLSLIMLDIDHFKTINDRYGHSVGDKVLVGVVRLLQRNIRDNDLLARWGGEEFIIVAPETADQAAVSLAEKLRSLLAETDQYDGLKVTGSFGVVQYDGTEGVDALVRRADAALYRAKEGGRDRVETG